MTAATNDLATRLRRLEDLEEIRQLKYRYWRCLDLKLWEEMATCFTPDAEASWGEGRYEFRGREALLGFLERALGTASGAITVHQGHHPEIDFLGADTARGRWSLYNYMLVPAQQRGVREAAFYDDLYVRTAEGWRIRRTGYRYVFHEEWSRADTPSLRLLQPPGLEPSTEPGAR